MLSLDVPESGHGEEPDRATPRLLPQTPCQLISAHARHQEVEDTHVRLELCGDRQGRLAVRTCPDFAPGGTEDFGGGFGRVPVVVHAQDSNCFTHDPPAVRDAPGWSNIGAAGETATREKAPYRDAVLSVLGHDLPLPVVRPSSAGIGV
jgi:hypothetical protein